MSLLKKSSVWNEAEIESFFADCVIPITLACKAGNGSPLVCSLWYMYDEKALWCATNASASIVKCLTENPECGFEVAPQDMPYRGVRGQGRVTVSSEAGMPVLLRLIDRYLGTRDSEFSQWLVQQATDEVALRIDPHWFTSWDFTNRMQG
ncbi:MAG: pyridoxamine 5'-phosphate oxidase family protein [Gammaproteobacteria bacterium]